MENYQHNSDGGQGSNAGYPSATTGGNEGVNISMLAQPAGIGGDHVIVILNQLRAKIEALEHENKALKGKLEAFESGQGTRFATTTTVPAQNPWSRSFGHDAMDLDDHDLSPKGRTFPKGRTGSLDIATQLTSPPKETKGRESETRESIGAVDLAINDDGEKSIIYIPTSCFTALLEQDTDGRRKLGEFRNESGAKIIIAPSIKRPGSQSPLRKNVAKVVITGDQYQRRVAAMLIVNYRVAFLADQDVVPLPKNGKENINIFR